MRRLLPQPSDTVDLYEAYACPMGDDGFVRLNMISSIDGAITVGGKSGALGGPPDHKVFTTLRSWADVIFVGAGTVRAEQYGPAKLDADVQQRRRDRGQLPLPPIAVVTGSANFDFDAQFFRDANVKPLLVTSASRAPDIAALAGDAAEVITTGADAVDLRDAIAQLRDRGLGCVLAEGGPGLNSELTRDGLLDELCLTLSPRIVGGDGPRIIAGDQFKPPIEPTLVHLLQEDHFLFLRLALRA
jgi:riboflavin biosynthesis pyrimidine reductase